MIKHLNIQPTIIQRNLTKVLSDAVAKAQKVIDGTTSANDSEIVALDKEISDAISGLKEATGLDKYNKVLKNAKALNEADYTAESWADLQAVITAQEGKVTEENADQASADLQSAVDALVPMSTAVPWKKVFTKYRQHLPIRMEQRMI